MPDTTYNYPRSFAENRLAERRAGRLADDAARGLLAEANMAADYAARFLACMKNAGHRSDRLEALRDVILDAFGDVQGGINRELDDAGLHSDQHQIDLTELQP